MSERSPDEHPQSVEPVEPEKPEYSPQEAARLYLGDEALGIKGLPVDDIAEKFGVSTNQVRKGLRALGIQMRPQGHQRELTIPEESELEKLVKEGYSQRQIAEHYGVSRGTVEDWLSKFGLLTYGRITGRPGSNKSTFLGYGGNDETKD